MGARAFEFRYGILTKQDDYLAFRSVYRNAIGPIFLSAVFALVLLWADAPVVAQLKELEGFPPGFKNALESTGPQDGDYVAFLIAVSTIGGLFIGLYFAAVTTVASAIYARVPSDIRQLLSHERSGNVYIRFLSFVTFLCIALVALRLLGFPRVWIAIPIVALAAGIGIFAFVQLGRRAFDMFDPTALSTHLFQELEQWLAMVTAGGHRWRDPSFQQHAHRLASRSLDTLATLAELNGKESHLAGAPNLKLCSHLIRFMIRYESRKSEIPSNSGWFQAQYRHRDWYRTEDTRVAIAHQTGTRLDPEKVGDSEWLEKRLIPIVVQCFRQNLESERHSELIELFAGISYYVGMLSRNGRAQFAISIAEELLQAFQSVILQSAERPGDRSKELGLIGIAEYLASLPIEVSVGFRNRCEVSQGRNFHSIVRSIDWLDDASIYRQGLTATFIPRLEWLQHRLKFEKRVEGKLISPIWYQAELLGQIEAEIHFDTLKALTDRATKFYTDAIKRETEIERSWIAAALASRAWEFLNKLNGQLPIWEAAWLQVSEKRSIDGLPWPAFNKEELASAIESFRDSILEFMPRQSVLLSLDVRPEGFPDYAGQFLHTTGEAAFHALLGNRAELFAKIFEKFLAGSLVRYNGLLPKQGLTEWQSRHELKIASSVMLDVLDLSGYAKVFGELHGEHSYWESVTKAWDEARKQLWSIPPQEALGVMVSLTESDFEIPHRALIRTSWRQALAERLSKLPRGERRRRRYSSDFAVEHESPLVRVFAEGLMGGAHDGIDVFIAYYVRQLEKGEEVSFGRRRRDLRDVIQREEERHAQNLHDGEADR